MASDNNQPNRITFRAPMHPNGGFSLKIDGHEIRHVRVLKIESDFQEATKVTIEMFADVEGMVDSTGALAAIGRALDTHASLLKRESPPQ